MIANYADFDSALTVLLITGMIFIKRGQILIPVIAARFIGCGIAHIIETTFPSASFGILPGWAVSAIAYLAVKPEIKPITRALNQWRANEEYR